MKVLFQSHYGIGRMYGGGPSVIYSMAEALTALGVSVTFHDYWQHDAKDFDLVHYFGCYDNTNWFAHLPDDPPLVVTPISWFDQPLTRRVKQKLLYALRVAIHRTTNRRRLGYPYTVPAHFSPNSQGEAYYLARAYQVPREKMTIVPHGVSIEFAKGDATMFEREYKLRDFVLCVGRFEHPRKNQLMLVRAMKDQSIPLVFIGGAEAGSQWYYDQCRSEADSQTFFIPPVKRDDPMLISAYHACKVLAMPALLESPGLTGCETALAGANLALTKNGSTREYFGDDAWYFDPRDAADVRRAVLQAYQSPRRPQMKQRVLDRFTWPQIARVQVQAYERILAAHPRAGGNKS